MKAKLKSKPKSKSKPKPKTQVKAKPKPKPKPTKKTKAKKTEKTSYWPRSSERALVTPLSEDLRDTYDKLKSVMVAEGAQYIYASAKAIMFARSRCFAFVRPKKKYVELTLILNERYTHPILKRVDVTGKRFQHVLHLTHADQIEEPLTEWVAEAYRQAPEGIPPNFRGDGGGDDVEIIEEGGGLSSRPRPSFDFDEDDLNPEDLDR